MNMTHTRLLVSDFRACFLFYRDKMGFPVTWGDENGPYADLDTHGHTLALFDRHLMAEALGAPPPSPIPETDDAVCLVFAVQDVDETHDALLQKGVATINQPHDRTEWGIRCFHLRDPDGTLIEINKEFRQA